MQLDLYFNKSESIVIGKEMEQVGSAITGVLHSMEDVSNPVFEIHADTVPATNYCYCAELGRYYFITSIDSIRNGLFRLNCHVDVLETYKTPILQQFAIVARSEKKWNLYGNDQIFKTFQNPIIVTREFPAGFPAPQFILAVAGG